MLKILVEEEEQRSLLFLTNQYLKIFSIEMNTFQKCLRTMFI